MASESHESSLIWDSSSSPQLFHSSSFSNIPSYFDRSLVAPVTLSQRKSISQATILQLPPLKLRSTITWHSTEDEHVLVKSNRSSEQENNLFKQKYDRLRASLCVRFPFAFLHERFVFIKLFPLKIGNLVGGMCILIG